MNCKYDHRWKIWWTFCIKVAVKTWPAVSQRETFFVVVHNVPYPRSIGFDPFINSTVRGPGNYEIVTDILRKHKNATSLYYSKYICVEHTQSYI